MKAENMMDAIGMLEENFLAESLPKKRRNFRPLAAVAAVAAALAVTVGAVSLTAEWAICVPEDSSIADYIKTVTIEKTNLSEEALLFLRETAKTKHAEQTFESVDDIETMLGLNLLEADFMQLHDEMPPCIFLCDSVAPKIQYVYESRDRFGVLTATLNVWAQFSLIDAYEYECYMRNVGSPDFQLYEIEHLGVTAQLGTDENIEELGGVYCFFVYDSIAYEMLLCNDSMEQVKEMLEKLTLEG